MESEAKLVMLDGGLSPPVLQYEIVGYLFRPQTPGPHPAIVLLHGRGGLYSTNVNKGCTLVARNTPSASTASRWPSSS